MKLEKAINRSCIEDMFTLGRRVQLDKNVEPVFDQVTSHYFFDVF